MSNAPQPEPPPLPRAVAWPPVRDAPADPIMEARIAAGSVAEVIDPKDMTLARVRQI